MSTDDRDDLADVVERAYAALDFPPGSEPDWAAFNAVFHPRAVLALRVFPTDAAVTVVGLEEYAVEQMRNDLGAEGYGETPGARAVEVVGDIAVVRQEFTMDFAGGPVDAVDVFSLVRSADAWSVVAVVSDVVRA